MKILHSTEKYLHPLIVEQCFEPGRFLSTDKQICGNGFSTAFFNLDITPGGINIIIAPNVQFLKDKQSQYKANPYQFKHKMKFFHKESKDNDFNADVLCFVADSFLARKESIKSILNRIDKVLIDESHTAEIQSIFRQKVLKDFDTKVKAILCNNNISIAKVTASPNLFNDVDIFIENEGIKETKIYYTQDIEQTIKRIKGDLKDNKEVLLFTNSATNIYNLRDYKNRIKANFLIGDNLMRGLTELAKIIQDDNSNLTIGSSRSFEGWDYEKENANVYFLEDRSVKYESFFISQVYQAFNRARKGANRIEYCRRGTKGTTKQKMFKDIDTEIDSFIDPSFTGKNKKTKKIEVLSTENKQRKEFHKYHKFVVFTRDDNGMFSIKRDDVAINLHKESIISDKPDFPQIEFKEFIDKRKLVFINMLEGENRLTRGLHDEFKVKNLKKNEDLITKRGLFGDDYKLEIKDFHTHKITDSNKYRFMYLKHLEEYLRRKNYNGVYTYTERQNIALNILKDEKTFNRLVKDVTKTYNARSEKKYGKKESESYRKDFKIKSANMVGMFIIMFSNRRVKLPERWSANRDYNLSTKIGTDELNIISDAFKTDFLEVDVRNCFSRILYAICGKPFPIDFYGKDKVNKHPINKFLNNFFYNEDYKTEKKKQKYKAIEKFRGFGFDEDVIKYLMDNFFECKHRGDLFTMLSYHEMNIVSKVLERCNLNNEGIIRRHDSILLFDNKSDISFINDYTFLGQKGWFDVKIPPVYEIKKFNGYVELQDYKTVG